MLAEQRTKESTQKQIAKLAQELEKKGFGEVKVALPGYEQPYALTNKDKGYSLTPDITALVNGRRAYIEVSKKTKDRNQLATKWKLLSQLAQLKHTSFRILVPHGTMKFTKEMLEQFHISADLIKV